MKCKSSRSQYTLLKTAATSTLLPTSLQPYHGKAEVMLGDQCLPAATEACAETRPTLE